MNYSNTINMAINMHIVVNMQDSIFHSINFSLCLKKGYYRYQIDIKIGKVLARL